MKSYRDLFGDAAVQGMATATSSATPASASASTMATATSSATSNANANLKLALAEDERTAAGAFAREVLKEENTLGDGLDRLTQSY